MNDRFVKLNIKQNGSSKLPLDSAYQKKIDENQEACAA
jgi:hypothetical protein